MLYAKPLTRFVLAFALLASSVAASELRLLTELDGEMVGLSGVDDQNRLLAGPQNAPISTKTPWRLEGDLAAAAPLARWAPVTAVRRADERAVMLTPGKPWRATVQVRHVPLEGFTPHREIAPLLSDWPEGLPKGGAAAVAWLVGGSAVDVILLPLPSTETNRQYGVAAEFQLSDDHLADGQPVVFLWKDGSFVAPQPLFQSVPEQEALIAVRRDDATALAAALGRGARADAISRDGYSLLHYAADAGAVQCIELLAGRGGARVDQTDVHGWTPLHHAAAQNRLAAVETLLGAKAKVNARGAKVPLALSVAVERGHAAVVDALLARRAATADKELRTDPIVHAMRHGHADIAEKLRLAKARYDFKAPQASHELRLAAFRGHLSVVRWLVERGVDPNLTMQGMSALSIAAREGDAATAKALLAAGAQVDKPTKSGSTPLMAAAQYGNLDYARALLEGGANPRAATEDGLTSLHLAAQADAPELVALLLERGADLAARTRSDYTALDLALLTGAPESARLLARRGATISLGTASSETLLTMAVRLDVAEAVDAALKQGWPARSTLAGVWPATRVAQVFRSHRVLELLLAAGAPPPSDDQPTALVTLRELDEPLALARQTPMNDPRESHEVFPEQRVLVQFLIDAQGRPLFPAAPDVEDRRIGRAAIEGLLEWRFAPPRRNGQPVAVRATVPLVFPGSDKRAFDLARLDQAPVPLKQPAPVFPLALKRQGIQGRAEIGFIVGTDGKTLEHYVIHATHPAFGEAAMEAIKQWVFKPGSIDGTPVNTNMRQPLSFTLNF